MNALRNFAVTALAVALPTAALCGTTTWVASSAGWWTNAGNWSAGVPGAGDDAIFNNSSTQACFIDADITVQNLTIADDYSSSLVFAQGTAATINVSQNFYLGKGSRVVCNYTSTNGLGTGRAIFVGGDATINGILDAAGRGFPNDTSSTGYRGPGGSGASWTSAHGGLAGDEVGNVYGSVTNPTSLGSGSHQNNGGGAIRLDVGGVLTVNGTVTAMPTLTGTHGASGGSIWLNCNTFAGTGLVTAAAGRISSWGHGGGGGRVAITYSSRTFNGRVTVARGEGTFNVGQPGSLWEPGLYTNPVAHITLDGVGYQYFFPATASNYVWGITLTNNADLFIHDFTNGALVLTNIHVSGNPSRLRFDIDEGGRRWRRWNLNSVAVSGGMISVRGPTSVVAFCEGQAGPAPVDVSLTATSALYLAATTHVLRTLFVEQGSRVYGAPGNTNAINPDSGGTAGVPHGLGMVITCATAVVSGAVDVSHIGFWYRCGPGRGRTDGWWDGGGYGGEGGHQVLPAAGSGQPYGSLTRPSALGSGCSYGDYSTNTSGGGALKLVATNMLRIDGIVRADGGTHGSYGGASGGSLWLVTHTFAGTGGVSAVGGYGNPAGAHGGGGGGRIAIEWVNSSFSGWISVSNGLSQSSAAMARTGTVFLCQSPVFGACSLGANGRTLRTTRLNIESNDIKLARNVILWDRSLAWQESCTRVSSPTVVSNTVHYVVGGLSPRAKCTVWRDSTPICGPVTNADENGSLAFSVDLTDSSHTIVVQLSPPGTLFVVH